MYIAIRTRDMSHIESYACIFTIGSRSGGPDIFDGRTGNGATKLRT
jgi:hypothetical protein